LAAFVNPEIEIINANTFNYNFSKKYDLVIGNVPWAMPVEYNGKKMKSEEAFIRKAFEICSEFGEIIIIVPYSFLYGNLYKKIRDEFSSNIKSIIGLPQGIMNFSSLKTAILHFTSKKSDSINIGIVKSLDDLGKPYNKYYINKIKKNSIYDRWDPEFYSGVDLPLFEESKIFDMKPLSELAQIIHGAYIPSEDVFVKGDFLYLLPRHIKDNLIDSSSANKYVLKSTVPDRFVKCIAQPGDIIISIIFNDLKLYVFKHDDPPCIVSNNMAIIRSINDDYIISYLKTKEGKKNFNIQADKFRRKTIIPNISINDLKKIRIPVLPFSELNKLGDKSISNASIEELSNLKETFKDLINEARLTTLNEIKVFIEDRVIQIQEKLEKIEKKVDDIIDILSDLSKEFKIIKNLQRSANEKFIKMYYMLDDKLDLLLSQKKKIETYIEIIKTWLNKWEDLDANSKKILPVAEYIFDELNQIENADYSPFIVQYCRSIENEILKKLFITYHQLGLKHKNLDELLKNDLDHPKTGKFARMVKRNKTNYTLGDMNFILSLLKEEGNTFRESILLQHFKNFSTHYFEQKLFEKEFIRGLNDITENYRNKAAHPNVINLSTAQQCQNLLRENLNYFLECKK